MEQFDAHTRVVQAQQRVADEERRALRAGAIAARHERLELSASAAMVGFHARMATRYRSIEQRHRVALGLHAAYAESLKKWAARSSTADSVAPVFMSAVADACGSHSATITLLDAVGTELLVMSSDARAAAAQTLEFALGQGPSHDAFTSGHLSVMEAELTDRWPAYGPAVAELGVHEISAVPLRVADVQLGALAVYGPCTISADAMDTMASAVAHSVLLSPQARAHPAELADLGIPSQSDQLPALHQAAGIVAVQANCTPSDALALIRAHAFANDQTVGEVAELVVGRRLRFTG